MDVPRTSPGSDAHAAPIINITGELVTLGAMRRDLLPLYQRWINDFGTQRYLAGSLFAYTLEKELAWYDRIAVSDHDTPFTIYERSTFVPIGTTGLHLLDFRNRTAEFGILIGEVAARGKGYGTETCRLVLDYAFTGLGLHNVMLRVYAYNEAGLRAYVKAGFREFGRRRESQLMGGKLWDVVYMECLASEFTSPVLAKILMPDGPGR
jgi:RimJ/RimL family protein N-acetyltransferase